MTENETFEQKEFDGVVVRRSNQYPKLWASENGQILGPAGKWLQPGITGGAITKGGRLTVCLRSRTDGLNTNVKVHRLVAETWVLNPAPADLPQVDHISGDPMDNAANNLRWVTTRQNQQNQRSHREKSGSSRYVGVFNKIGFKSVAKIFVDGKRKYLGSFADEADAGRAYDAALVALGLQPVNFPA